MGNKGYHLVYYYKHKTNVVTIMWLPSTLVDTLSYQQAMLLCMPERQ